MNNTGLLSRIAETLFWTGRYIERADDTARLVDVYVHRMLEEPRADEDAGCRDHGSRAREPRRVGAHGLETQTRGSGACCANRAATR